MLTIQKEEGCPVALLPTYLAMVEGSIGSNQYRKLFVCGPTGVIDVIGDGDLACALFVSSMLYLCDLAVGGIHTTVDETVKDLETSGWYAVPEPCPGCVIVWASKLGSDGKRHRHIGIAVDSATAVSNSAEKRVPKMHGIRNLYVAGGEIRPIEAIYYHPILTK
jgi:hypothetical protein